MAKIKDPQKLWNKLHPWYIRAMWYTVAHIVARGRAREWLKKAVGGVLCLGSGAGIETHELEREGVQLKITAVDISDEGLEAHKDLNPNPANEHVCMDSLKFLKSQPDGSWSDIYALNSTIFESMEELREYFRELHRVLAPGGRFWISVVHFYGPMQILKIQANVGKGFFNSLRAIWHFFANWRNYKDLREFVWNALQNSNLDEKIYLSQEEWEKEIRAAGLEIEVSLPIGGYAEYQGKPIGAEISGIKSHSDA